MMILKEIKKKLRAWLYKLLKKVKLTAAREMYNDSWEEDDLASCTNMWESCQIALVNNISNGDQIFC
jgi:hypothetical protein